MSADKEDDVREGVEGMEKSGQEMEEHRDQVEASISEAKETAANRQDAPEKAPPMEQWGESDEGDEEESGGPDVEESATDDDATVGDVTEEHDPDVSAEADDDEDDEDDSDDDEDSSEDDDSDDSPDDDGDVEIATPET